MRTGSERMGTPCGRDAVPYICSRRGQLNRALKLLRVLRHSAYWPGLLRGVAASVEHEQLLARLPCKTVVDIGANRGQFALVARFCCPMAKVISFEPLPEAAGGFSKVFPRDRQVVLHQVAVGPRRAEALLYVTADDDSSSLLPTGHLQQKVFPRTALKRTIVVNVAPLSDYVDSEEVAPPALLKLDVQGFELEALRGCQTLLDRFQYVIAECSFSELYKGQALAHEVIRFLERYDLHLVGVYNLSSNLGRALQGDFAFARQP